MTKSVKVDVIVVGGGPAGVASVRTLTAGGARVALIEKTRFPRSKPCAGGLSAGAVRLLDYDFTTVVREKVNELRLSYKDKKPVIIKAEEPIALMTKRAEFDSLGIEAALSTECQYFVLPEISGIELRRDAVELIYPGLRIKGNYLVAADGAGSTIRRLISGQPKGAFGVAIEADVDANEVNTQEIRTKVDFGFSPGGYGWVFPKGDHYNVGLYSWNSRHSRFVNRPALKQYAQISLGEVNLSDIRGFPIAISCSKKSMGSGRVLFVGDAGGFTYASSGEGIYGAILTGQLAAKSVLIGGDVVNNYRATSSRYLRRCGLNRAFSRLIYPTLGVSYPLFAAQLNSQAMRASMSLVDSEKR